MIDIKMVWIHNTGCNILTSAWTDVTSVMFMNDATVYNKVGGAK
jgi:hypothetical protein